MRKQQLSVVIPAFNEGLVIESSLQALKRVIDRRHIYVVSDGSTDNTVRLARKMGVRVMALSRNIGKANALKKLITAHHLTTRYEYVLFSDADSRLSEGFVKAIKAGMNNRPAGIVGTVSSQRHGLISAYRAYEYGLAHLLYRQAQHYMGVINIAPGCATAYRADVLDKVTFSNQTLTEDYDLTLQIHAKKLGKIIYAPRATVVTQDPANVKDFWRQILRWQTGFWQNYFLHRLYVPKRAVNWETYLLLLDSLLGIAILTIALTHPIAWRSVLITFYLTFTALAASILMIKKQFWGLKYAPIFVLFQLMNTVAYIYAFMRVVGKRRGTFAWHHVGRYALKNS